MGSNRPNVHFVMVRAVGKWNWSVLRCQALGVGTWASTYRANLERLTVAQKPSAGTAVYSRRVNRPLGRRVAAWAALTGMSPNTASVISAAMSGVALLLVIILAPSWPMSLAAASLLAGAYVMDSVDGQLARLRGEGSLSGEWLDHTIDCFKTSLVHVAVLISWYRFPPVAQEAILLVPLGYGVVQTVTYFGLILMPMLRSKGSLASQSNAAASPTGSEAPWRTWLLLPTDYGTLVWAFALLAAPLLFATVYTALALVNALALTWGLRKWWRELRHLDEIAQGRPDAR